MNKEFHPGRLKDRAIIERLVVGEDPVYGTPTQEYVSILFESGSPTRPQSIAAEFEDVLPSRSEGVRMGVQVAANQTRVRMRYMSGVDSTMRIKKVERNGTFITYNIIAGPAVIGRNEGIEFMCERYSV